MSEAKFEELADSIDRKSIRFGFNRPPFSITKLDKTLRYAPDYLSGTSFIECMGFGRDQTLKLKREKLDAMVAWSKLHPVEFFLWDSHKKRWSIVNLERVVDLIDQGHSELSYFHDGLGKAFFAIKSEHLGEWTGVAA